MRVVLDLVPGRVQRGDPLGHARWLAKVRGRDKPGCSPEPPEKDGVRRQVHPGLGEQKLQRIINGPGRMRERARRDEIHACQRDLAHRAQRDAATGLQFHP